MIYGLHVDSELEKIVITVNLLKFSTNFYVAFGNALES